MEISLNLILEVSLKLFLNRGIKSQTMDDIANGLKISKKTLYQFVTDKQDLVLKTVKKFCFDDIKMISEVKSEASNAIEESVLITKHVKKKFTSIHPSIMYDLEKYYPEAWDVFQNHQNNFVFETVKNNLNNGIAEGYYAEDIIPEIIAKAYISKLYAMTDRSDLVLAKYDFGTLFVEFMKYHLRGIVSEKGLRYLKQKIKTLYT